MSTSREEINRVRRIKEKHEEDLLRKANVVGVGVGRRDSAPGSAGQPAIIVSVTHKVSPDQLRRKDLIPHELEGIPVEVRAVGRLRPHGDPRA